MSEDGNDQMKAFVAGLLGFVVVVVLGGLLILRQGGVTVKAPVANYAPVEAAPAPAPSAQIPVSRPARAAVASSPAPLLPAGDLDEPATAAPAPAPSAAAASGPAAAKLAVSQHLDPGSSAESSASASAAPAHPSAKAPAAKKKGLLAPKLDLSKNQGSLVTTVHYGVSNRAELMGRAAGPVYNFSGKNAAAQGAPGGPAQGDADSTAAADAGATGVDAARQSVDASPLSPEDKAKILENLNQAQQTMQPPPKGQ
jgi:hypothetical protein